MDLLRRRPEHIWTCPECNDDDPSNNDSGSISSSYWVHFLDQLGSGLDPPSEMGIRHFFFGVNNEGKVARKVIGHFTSEFFCLEYNELTLHTHMVVSLMDLLLPC